MVKRGTIDTDLYSTNFSTLVPIMLHKHFLAVQHIINADRNPNANLSGLITLI